jgi:Fur family transcriptional regulator, ferric uptake regulator
MRSPRLSRARVAANRARAEWMLQRLVDAGERMTGQREVVVNAIAAEPGAFSAEALTDELRPRGVARATVYRTIELLDRLGMLTRMHLDDRHVYTVCDEGHHHHLVCKECGTVAVVDADGVEAEIQALAAGLEFRVDAHTLEFAGYCEDCVRRAG